MAVSQQSMHLASEASGPTNALHRFQPAPNRPVGARSRSSGDLHGVLRDEVVTLVDPEAGNTIDRLFRRPASGSGDAHDGVGQRLKCASRLPRRRPGGSRPP